MLTVPLYY